METLDGLPDVEWPVRHRARVDDGRLHLTMVSRDLSPGDVVKAFAARDLREETFVKGTA